MLNVEGMNELCKACFCKSAPGLCVGVFVGGMEIDYVQLNFIPLFNLFHFHFRFSKFRQRSRFFNQF